MSETATTDEMWDALGLEGWTRRGPGSWHWKDPETGFGEGHRLITPDAHQLMVEREEELARQETERKRKAKSKAKSSE